MISGYLRYILIIILILALCNIFISIDQKIIEANSILTEEDSQTNENCYKRPWPFGHPPRLPSTPQCSSPPTKEQVTERINFIEDKHYFSLLETFFNEMMIPEIFKIDYFQKQSVN